MSKRKITGRRAAALGIAVGLLALTGCQQDGQDHRVQVELVSYKPEAVAAFEKIAERFNETHTGENTFSASYREVAEKIRTLLDYAEPNPYAYSYNDACTAFARGQSAMYPIGSYAIPQIKSVNPDMNLDSFTFPANSDAQDNVLNSGVDLQFCVMKNTPNKEAVYEVLRFLYQDETIQIYLDDQGGLSYKDSDFALPAELEGLRPYIESDRMADYQDHHYPSEMSVDAMIQTYLHRPFHRHQGGKKLSVHL